jgi:hypothetical protein
MDTKKQPWVRDGYAVGPGGPTKAPSFPTWKAAAVTALARPSGQLFLTARNGAEPDAAQRYARGFRIRRIDDHCCADDVDRGRGNGSRALNDNTRVQNELRKGTRDMSGERMGVKVGYVERNVGEENSVGLPCHKPDAFCHSTEVRADECRRHPHGCSTAIIFHAGKTIDDNFGIAHRCLNWLGAGKRSRCGDPMNGLHVYLPGAGRDAPALEG